MGNLTEKKEENKDEQKENLETEEIPPDTQINNENKEVQETEIVSEQANQENHEEEQAQVQQDQQIEQVQERQEQQEGEIVEEQVKEEEEGGHVEANGKGGEGEEEEREEEEEKGMEGQQFQITQEGQANMQDQQQYQFVKDGQLYIRQNGQLYKVIQEVEPAQEGEEMNGGYHGFEGQAAQQWEQNQNNKSEEVQIAQPIYQYIDQNQQVQQIQPNIYYGNMGIQQMQQKGQNLGNIGVEQFQQMQQGGQYIVNMGMQQNQAFDSNIEIGQENAQYQIGQADTGNYQQKIIQIQTKGPKDQFQMMDQSPISKSGESYRGRRREPKDSIPKMHIVSNRGSMINSQSQNSNSFMRSNLNKNLQKNLKSKHYNFDMNKSEKQITKSNQINVNAKIVKNENRINLRENKGFVEIPRKEYDNYLNKETIILNSGMDTGEYKFIGDKTIIKEVDALDAGKININQEEIIQEINRRNKATKEKKISYEIIDKFYALTEVRGKTIKRLDKKGLNLKNKQHFYSTLENNNYNISANMNINSNSNYNSSYVGNYNSNYGGNANSNYNGNLKGFSKNAAFGKFQGGYKESKASSSKRGAYYEFRSEIPFTSNSNFSNFNNINSITSMPTDNYSKYILEQINRIRLDPQSFIGVIEDAKANITKDRFGRLIYNGKKKIALAQGESCFNEAIEFLKNSDSVQPLKYISYLTVMPPQNEREIKDKDDLGRKVTDMINGGIDIKSYWRDIIKDPEISFLLMIVDDNGVKTGMRRRDILNPNMKFIGISSVEINKNFVCYITLS